jgi:hypothetical protein
MRKHAKGKSFAGLREKLAASRPDRDEETALMEVSEDRRLLRLGIDPDGDPVDIMLDVEARYRELKASEKKP